MTRPAARANKFILQSQVVSQHKAKVAIQLERSVLRPRAPLRASVRLPEIDEISMW